MMRKNEKFKILLHGLNFSPEEIGVGKYSGEMVEFLLQNGVSCCVVTTPPYYPHWKIRNGYSGFRYQTEKRTPRPPTTNTAPAEPKTWEPKTCVAPDVVQSESLEVVRCPVWVPKQVNGMKRILHLASFGISSWPVVLWKAITFRPRVIMTVEPAAFCMPATLLAARLTGAKAWLHIQDFEVDAAFELGILKQPLLKKLVRTIEAFLMRRFDLVSSISGNMVQKAIEKGVPASRMRLFPNWVDCDVMRPLPDAKSLCSKFQLPSDKCIALYSGNLGAKQGISVILEAAKMARNHPNLFFVICGHGAVYEMTAGDAADLPNVRMLPVQPIEVFNDLMNCADIHLLPQRADAADLVMPSKLTGMLATGRPVVACAGRNTQIAKVVSHRGIVVPPGQVERFFQAILLLAEDSDLRKRLGDHAREYAVKYLGKRAILEQFVRDLSCSENIFSHSDLESEMETEKPIVDERILTIENSHLQPTDPNVPKKTIAPRNL